MSVQTSVTLRRRFIDRWVLPASLLLNFFALGVAASPWVHNFHGEHHVPLIERMTQGLPEADAQKLRQAYEADEPSLEENHETIRASMHKISAILAAPEPDQAELQKTLDDITAAQANIHKNMADLIKHAATDLSPKARQIVAKRGLQSYARHN